MVKLADLHLHSTASDGLLTPTELVRKFGEAGIRCLALTDHDTVEGVEEAHREAERTGVEFISGIELSASFDGCEAHILGLGIDPAHASIAEHSETMYRGRVRRLEEMLALLEREGVLVDRDEVMAEVADGMPGRPHLARVLAKQGIVEDESEAFRLYLRDGGMAFSPKPLPRAVEAIRLIHRAGGAAILAHPGHSFTDHDVRILVESGLDGLEIVHPSHTPELEEYYRRLCERFGLIPSGGSDYHGARAEEDLNIGRSAVPLSWAERVRTHADRFRIPSD